jgi:ankyrin repeat protein
VERGCDVNEQDFQNWSLAHCTGFAGRNDIMKFLLENTPLDVDLNDIDHRSALNVAIETRSISKEDDIAVQLVNAECTVDPSVLQRVLIYSLKHDETGFPSMMISKDKEEAALPLLKSKVTANSFSLIAVIKYEAVKVLGLIFENYEK